MAFAILHKALKTGTVHSQMLWDGGPAGLIFLLWDGGLGVNILLWDCFGVGRQRVMFCIGMGPHGPSIELDWVLMAGNSNLQYQQRADQQIVGILEA